MPGQTADNFIVVYFGGIIMNRFKALMAIFLVFGLTFVSFGCATGKNSVSKYDFRITAETVPEGILVKFINIPADASHMFLAISTVDENENPESPCSIISSYAALTNTNEMDWVFSSLHLEKIKQTGKFIFPFVKPGSNYFVSAHVYNLQEREQYIRGDENLQRNLANAEVTAKNGIYYNRDDVRLEFNSSKTAVTLSSQPVFSSEVTFADQMYSYAFTIQVESGSLGVGDHHIPEGLSSDGLTWVFEPQMSTVNLKEYDLLKEGEKYPAWASAFVNILYEDIIWSINIAHTPLGEFSL